MIKLLTTILASVSLISFFPKLSSDTELENLLEEVTSNTPANNAALYGFSFYKSNSVQIISNANNEITLGIAGNNVYMNIITVGMDEELEVIAENDKEKFDFFYQNKKIIIEISRNANSSFIKVFSNNSSIVAEVPSQDEALVVAEMALILSSIKVSPTIAKEEIIASDSREITVNNSKQNYFNSIHVKSNGNLNMNGLSLVDQQELYTIEHEKSILAKKR